MTTRSPPPDTDLAERRELLDAAGVARTLRRMALEIAECVPQDGSPLYLVGVRTGGAFLAQRLCALLAGAGESRPQLGAVDISLYRDDVFRGLPKPEIGPTDLPEPIQFGIGIHGGDVIIGDIGYRERTVFTALGDAVNVAARLQDMTKTLGCTVIVSQDVLTTAGVSGEPLDYARVEVRGREEQISVRTGSDPTVLSSLLEAEPVPDTSAYTSAASQ